jgi:hypothetical protein
MAAPLHQGLANRKQIRWNASASRLAASICASNLAVAQQNRAAGGIPVCAVPGRTSIEDARAVTTNAWIRAPKPQTGRFPLMATFPRLLCRDLYRADRAEAHQFGYSSSMGDPMDSD